MNIENLIDLLKLEYPAPECELDYNTPHELLIAARLSAQCTDKRVNLVTPKLFETFKNVDEFANANVSDIEKLIKSCGLYKTKAASIKGMCEILRDEHGGVIPSDFPSLLNLPGIGRKTANLIRGELFKLPAIVTDTHVIRLSNRLGLAVGKNPLMVENILLEIISPEESMAFCHRLVLHGRRVCSARKPNCDECRLVEICPRII